MSLAFIWPLAQLCYLREGAPVRNTSCNSPEPFQDTIGSSWWVVVLSVVTGAWMPSIEYHLGQGKLFSIDSIWYPPTPKPFSVMWCDGASSQKIGRGIYVSSSLYLFPFFSFQCFFRWANFTIKEQTSRLLQMFVSNSVIFLHVCFIFIFSHSQRAWNRKYNISHTKIKTRIWIWPMLELSCPLELGGNFGILSSCHDR